jgi:CheY-like chemotaxis protein
MNTKSKVVLIVDDEPMNRFIIKKILSSNTIQTLEASDGQKAFQVLYDQHVDIVLLDINMPIMDGYMFLKEISKDSRYFHLSIIVVSATNRGVFYDKIKNLGINAPQLKGFLEKPINIDDLKAIVNQF